MPSSRDIEVCTKHATNPEPGDYWSDHLVGVCVVLAVYLGNVVICRTKKDIDADHWTWDLTKLDTFRISEFNRWLSYSEIPGYWGEVTPRGHLWAVKEAEELNRD
jgi:hypothetical protein